MSSPMWNTILPDYCEWTINNESFIADITMLCNLIKKMLSADPVFKIAFDIAGDAKIGNAICTNLTIDATMGQRAKLTLTLEGTNNLSDAQAGAELLDPSEYTAYLKGKELMLGIYGSTKYNTLMCATSHKLTISCQTADSYTKDDNESSPKKVVTGYSMTVSSDNLIYTGSDALGVSYKEMMRNILNGQHIYIALLYANETLGKDATNHNWQLAGNKAVISGNAYVTSLNVNAQVKENATYSCELTFDDEPDVKVVTLSEA